MYNSFKSMVFLRLTSKHIKDINKSQISNRTICTFFMSVRSTQFVHSISYTESFWLKFSEKRFACFPEALSRRRNILFQPTAKDLPRLVNPFLPAICRSAIDIFVAKYISDKTYKTIEILCWKICIFLPKHAKHRRIHSFGSISMLWRINS